MSHYDKDGNPIDVLRWSELFTDFKYRRIVETTLPNKIWISTVWQGLDHSLVQGKPLIFETMVFQRKEQKEQFDTLDMARYSTLAEAKSGHAEMVKKWRAQMKDKAKSGAK